MRHDPSDPSLDTTSVAAPTDPIDALRAELQSSAPLPDHPGRLVSSGRAATFGPVLVTDTDLLAALSKLATDPASSLGNSSLATFVWLLRIYAGRPDIAVVGSLEVTPRAPGDGGQSSLRVIRTSVRDQGSFRELVADVAARRGAAPGRTADDRHATTLAHAGALPCHFEFGRARAAVGEVAAGPRPRVELGLRVCDRGDSLAIDVDYDAERHDEATVARIAEVYAHLLGELARTPDAPLATVDLVPPDQRAMLLRHVGATAAAPAGDEARTIDQLFRACVSAAPNRPAVTCQGQTLTYRELDRRADQLARHLLAAGLGAGEPVAIALAPSVEVLVAMLGVLRAGAAYLPLENGLAAARVQDILDDSGARFLVGAAAAPAFQGRVIDLTTLPPADPDAGPLPELRGSDPAYLIYTSGTTGRPKGVIIEHHSLVNYVCWFRARYHIGHDTTAALLTSHAFDLGYTTLWTTILSGGELHLLAEELRPDVPAIVRYLQDHRITFIKITPSFLSALLSSRTFQRDTCGSLRLIVTGGERVRVKDVERVYARLPDVLVVNHYGPTETTIGVLTHAITAETLATFKAHPVLGTPIGNTRVYVTSPDLKLLPAGAPGELLVAGRGVARGYHDRDALTRERFVADPFRAGDRAYRTGDLVRWRPDGTIEFLGRLDRQVKIRGYRVELAEIEHVLGQRLGVSEVVVLDQQLSEDNRVLCAYVVGEVRQRDEELRALLGEVLPEYMVPTYVTSVAAIPRTANGKLDVARLPKPQAAAAARPSPQADTETEQILVAMWAELLGMEAHAIGTSQNFFHLGGHSLSMIQLIADIDDRFGTAVPIPMFFAEGTISAIAKHIDGQTP